MGGLCFLVLLMFWTREIVMASPVYANCDTYLQECPDFIDSEQWQELTNNCCKNPQSETFHCQEDEAGKLLLTCQSVVLCEKGTYAHLNLTSSQGQQEVEVLCLPCESGLYEPYAKGSHRFRYQRCSKQVQLCRGDGKKVSRNGSASQDVLCTCNWEAGWRPHPLILECTNPSGFAGDSFCSCRFYKCQHESRMNSNFECAKPGPLTPLENVKALPTREISTTTAKARDSNKPVSTNETTDGDSSGDNQQTVKYIVVGGVLIVVVGVGIGVAFLSKRKITCMWRNKIKTTLFIHYATLSQGKSHSSAVNSPTVPQSSAVNSTTVPHSSAINQVTVPQSSAVNSTTVPQSSAISQVTVPQSSAVNSTTVLAVSFEQSQQNFTAIDCQSENGVL